MLANGAICAGAQDSKKVAGCKTLNTDNDNFTRMQSVPLIEIPKFACGVT